MGVQFGARALDVDTVGDLIRQLQMFKEEFGDVPVKVSMWDHATNGTVRELVDTFYDSKSGEVVIY